jgi:SAM-dependent methyltransferase
MTLPDYSEYLKQPGMLSFIEQQWKLNPHIHEDHAKAVGDAVKKYDINDVVEIGCGTGQLANILSNNCRIISYVGMDLNEECIKYAETKNSQFKFIVGDIRFTHTGSYADLVISFGFLKHFGLHEWSDIFKKITSFGEYFIFDMPIAYETKDDGTEFHHVWKSKQEIQDDIEAAGLELLEIVNPSAIEPIFVCKKK